MEVKRDKMLRSYFILKKMPISKLFVLMSLIFVLFLLVSCSSTENQCNADSDCVPVVCCHADSAVNKKFAPDCQRTLCTTECVANTLDCGQGIIKCIENTCQIKFLEE